MKNPNCIFLKHKSFNLLRSQYSIEAVVFLLFLVYIVIRAFSVFYIHDELVTKYAYMLDWNPIPYTGYFDANNHFFNSFLGGLFIRLFQNESMWVVRLPSLLAFPIYFWSIVSFRKAFRFKSNYWLFICLLVFSVFILDFFSLTRGYALAWSFLFSALSFTREYILTQKTNYFLFALTSWLLSMYSNLSLLIISLSGILFLVLWNWKFKQFKNLTFSFISLLPIGFMAYYSMQLQKSGKLYLGGKEGFLDVSVSSLSELHFGYIHPYLNYFFSILFAGIIMVSAVQLIKKQNWENQLFPIFLFTAVTSVFLLNLFLNVLYPLDRGITHLLLLFLGSIPFVLDALKVKRVALFILPFPISLFLFQVNFSYARNWKYEHFDERLLSSIPLKVENTPTSTGGRFWQIDNELTLVKNLPTRVFQDSPKKGDTLVDYLIQFEELRPKVLETYDIVFQDSISELTLFKRKYFLKRRKIFENEIQVNGNKKYLNLMTRHKAVPSFIRCSGKITNPNIYKDYLIIFVAEDSLTKEKYEYGALNPINSTQIQNNGSISFDFTYAFNYYPPTAQISCYLYNNQQYKIEGSLKLEQYEIIFE